MNTLHAHIMLLFVGAALHYTAAALTIDEIYQTIHATPSDLVIVCFMTPGECVKCQIAVNEAFTWLSTETPFKSHVKLVGIVRCNRKIEVQAFHKDNPIFTAVFPNYGKEKSNLQLSTGTRVAIYSKRQGLIGTINEKEYFGDIQSAFKRILKIK
ncbi:MAG: hypothetical protein IT211_06755 [Armatimonadetes bacterium]|nr:hypothetical protein [Armatimonadota bacterium]